MHNYSVQETVNCLKNCLHPHLYKTVHEDNNPGFVRKHLPALEKVSKRLEADDLKWLRWLLVKAKIISRIYVDPFKDLILTASILILMGGIPSLLAFPTKMPSVVVFCLLASVSISMLLGRVRLANVKDGRYCVLLTLL